MSLAELAQPSSESEESSTPRDDDAQGSETLDARPADGTQAQAPIYDEIVAELGDPTTPPS